MENIERDFKLFASDHKVSTSILEDYTKAIGSYIEPTVIEERTRNISQLSIFSRLFMERILFLGTEVSSDVNNIISSQLLFLEMENPEKPITMYINSPGGSVYDGMGIYDVMKYISCPVSTTCIGTAASMAAVILSSGEKGQRFALPHSQIMIHEPMAGIAPHTKCTDYLIEAEQMKKCKEMLIRVLAENAGMDYREMEEHCSRDKWFFPDECLPEKFGQYGLVDSVIERKK